MALDASVLVDLPEHGIAYKKVFGKTYVYYVTATYRNKNGNPTCDCSSIGRLDETSGKLIPNRNYYEIFLKQPIPPAGDLFCCGVYDVFDLVCDTLEGQKSAETVFPGALQGDPDGGIVYAVRGEYPVLHRCAYTETHRTAAEGVLSDTGCSKMLPSLRREDMMLFFREWMTHRKQDEYIAYDVS